MFKWQCQNEQHKDLHLVNLEDLNKEDYFKLLDNFVREAEGVNKCCLSMLKSFPEKGILFAFPTNYMQNFFSRDGYFTLYRWCVTENPRFIKGNTAATRLWKYLFSSLPGKLAYHDKNYILVDEHNWKNWYKEIAPN